MDNLQQIVQRQFTCEICDNSFLTNPSKKRHIKTVHGDEKKPFECNVCHKFLDVSMN